MPKLCSWFLAAALAFGAAAHADDAPRFAIERIVVSGALHVSSAIVIAESRLAAGQTYGEPELRGAVARVQRLPFVVHADFRLEKGSARGLYVLVIAIDEAKPLFFRYATTHGAIATLRTTGIVIDTATGEWTPQFVKETLRYTSEATTVGVRGFVGSKGMAYASVDRYDTDHYNLGYTQYGLFGTGASVAVLLQRRDVDLSLPEDTAGRTRLSFPDHLALQIAAAFPFGGNQALRASFYRQTDPFVFLQTTPQNGDTFRMERVHTDRGELAWRYDSTNDPLFPSDGTALDVGARSEKRYRTVTIAGAPTFVAARQLVDLQAQLDRHWELTSIQSLSAGATALTHDGRENEEYRLRAGYAANLWSRERAQRVGDLRFEAAFERVMLHYASSSSYGTARIGLAHRNSWGTLRLDLEYLGWRRLPR